MGKIDLRKLDHSARETLRKTVIRLHRRGHQQSTICRDLGLRAATVCTWVARYRKSGSSALKDQKPGRKIGQKRKLSPAQEARIREDIIEKTPDRYKLPVALWSANAVVEYIKQCSGLQMPIRTVRLYLSRWGFTTATPLFKKAYEQQDQAVRAARIVSAGDFLNWNC